MAFGLIISQPNPQRSYGNHGLTGTAVNNYISLGCCPERLNCPPTQQLNRFYPLQKPRLPPPLPRGAFDPTLTLPTNKMICIANQALIETRIRLQPPFDNNGRYLERKRSRPNSILKSYSQLSLALVQGILIPNYIT